MTPDLRLVSAVVEAPTVLAPQWDAIPATMRRYARWLLWVHKDGRKVPRAVRFPEFDCDQSLSKSHCSWEKLRLAPSTLNGPGFACGTVDKDVTITLVDLDHCRNPQTGVIEPWARRIISRLKSYAEVSPSGTGIHIFGIGALPHDAKSQQKVYKLEIYDRKRFSTVTGHHVPETPDDLQRFEPELLELYAEQQSRDYVSLATLFGLHIATRANSVDIVCPWAHEHSGTDGKRDAAFEVKDGKVVGFHCFHASHQDKHLGDVRQLFGIAKDKADTKNRRQTIVGIFGQLGVRFEHDVFADKIYLITKEGRREVDDATENRLFFVLEDEYHISPPAEYLSKLIDDLAREHPVHPVLDYFKTLQWDGKERIDRWLTTYGGAKDTELTRAIARIVLTAAVRRVRSPGCVFQELLVLESEVQGLNKSTALQTLCPNPSWFSDSLALTCGPKEVIEQTGGKWLIEIPDLSGMRKSDKDRLKAMLASTSDRARTAYAHRAVDRPRHFILIATTNDTSYLKDQTGNRRFWPVEIQRFDIDALRRDRDQLWAEAALREAAGDAIRLDPKFYEAAGAEQEKRRVEDPWERLVENAAVEVAHKGKVRWPVDGLWLLLDVRPERQTPELLQRLKTVMKRCGFREMTVVNKGANNRRERGWGRNGDGTPLLDE